MGIITDYRIDASYIRGLADADGTCDGVMISISNTNLELLNAVMQTLHKLKIKSGIYKNSDVVISSITGVTHKQPYRLSISAVDNLVRYASLIGFNIDYKMNHLVNYIRNQCRYPKPGNLFAYYKYLEMKRKGFGVTRMARELDMSLSTMQYRIKYKYPLDDDLIEALSKYQPIE